MPTYKQFGFTNVVNNVGILDSGAGYWTMTGAPGAVIEIDFGYRVKLKSLAFLHSQGSMGDYAIVGSNTPATGTGDAYVPANGDAYLATYVDTIFLIGIGRDAVFSSGYNLFDVHDAFDVGNGGKGFRYYRLILLGPDLPSVGTSTDPRFQDVRLTGFELNRAMVFSAYGYTTQSGLYQYVVDGL